MIKYVKMFNYLRIGSFIAHDLPISGSWHKQLKTSKYQIETSNDSQDDEPEP